MMRALFPHNFVVVRRRQHAQTIDDSLSLTMCVVNVNFFMMSALLPEVSTNYIARAAQCLYNVTTYYEMIRDETLPPDMIMDLVPLSMDSVRYMLGSCRVPGLHEDTLTVTCSSRHVIVIRYIWTFCGL